jgi:4-amino-4-deoxy-L-arabinose transferase-like glycosyltransferase
MPKVPFWVFILVAILYFAAVRVDTMDIDASQYAEISREMMKSGDYLHVYDRGADYLDKPPFLFWVSAASMKVFGVNTFAYKLPSILFALLALFATYRLARQLYNEVIGRMAALVLATCQGMFLMTNDIRCDTILMSWAIIAIWLIQEWVVKRKLAYMLGGCAAIAFGMLTKGPIALMVPLFSFISDWVIKRQWHNLSLSAFLFGAIIIAVLLIPMSIGLYQQFDMHPEKIVNGKQGVSGLRFFFWSQSFGRITGENPWKNDVNIFFLLQNMLWSFLPWIFLLLSALVINIITLIKQKFRLKPEQEWITTGGFIVTYLSLGLSAYQLPHYIFIAFPLAAIITAKFLHELIEEGKYGRLYGFMRPFHIVITSLLLLLVGVLMAYSFKAPPIFISAWAVCLIIWLYLALRKQLKGKLFWLPAAGLIIANIFLSGYVYPELLQYQVGSQVGRYIHTRSIPAQEVVSYKMNDPLNSIAFYMQDTLRGLDTITHLKNEKYILTMDKGLNELKNSNLTYSIEKQGPVFKVSELTPEFLNPETRSNAVRTYYLVKLK